MLDINHRISGQDRADFFDHSRRLLVLKSSRAYTGFFVRNIQQAQIYPVLGIAEQPQVVNQCSGKIIFFMREVCWEGMTEGDW